VRRATSADLRMIFLLQPLRAFAYGFASVILGASLARSGLSGSQVGAVFASLLAGSAIGSRGEPTGWGGGASTRRSSC
jgi:hypothetical protein